MSISRRAAIAVALAHLFPHSAFAARRFARYRWDTRKPIVVENKMGPDWNQPVREQVAAWKRAYPKFRFRVIYRPGPCRNRKRGIVICEASPEAMYPGAAYVTQWQREIRRVRIEMIEGYIPGINQRFLCHEFAHALGLTHNDRPDASCVAYGSSLTMPGPYDRRSLRLLYKKRGKRWP